MNNKNNLNKNYTNSFYINSCKSKQIVPVVTHINTHTSKLTIYKENINKVGIYCWTNKINNKKCIGSSISLTGRLSIYYSNKAMNNKLSQSINIIYNAILKYGHNNFSLHILEYCAPDILIEREQYYIDLLKPKYNILKTAVNRQGSKHSIETRTLIGINNKGKNHHFWGKIHSLETRIKIRESLKSSAKFNNSIKLRSKIKTNESKLLLSSRGRAVGVKVFYKNNGLFKEFPTIKSTALHFNISGTTVRRYLDKNKFYNGYAFISSNKYITN